MKRTRIRIPIALILTAGLAAPASAIEILRWERLPLAVPLQVGQERVVFIDRNVRVGVPASVGSRLRVQSAAGAIYLRASEPIEPTRLQLQDADSGALILLDIVAEPAKAEQPPLEPVRIIEGETTPVRYGDLSAASGEDAGESSSTPSRALRETPIPVVLTRYAAQNLYAPLRTVEPVAGITRTTVRRNLALGSLMPTQPVRAQALGGWRLDDYRVTAVRLTNLSKRWITLDPRDLQGDFATGTFQHDALGPAGTPDDTTVVYLVTKGHGLAEALLPVVGRIDAGKNGGRHAQ
ncbi:TIGR03749 family integrating conjugative element protein [Shinella sumterensis]|uniref:Integrating conjugative element protein (TIGR03749 family) n=1 Tax=Rhizobium subbaraonis TaxID=908946 RepID=A0A285US49_9HYPH|nr:MULTISPECIES: TIGR03749 family integrating conjugative element protein [Rhizobiaceae]MCW5712343.1 TIGR03749 family integrating conjugative element protein [Shinella sp.]WLS08748.1 TIGR03749 family integrating conjugative element protein [Shinella sumterensis]SOC44735.1 integrating conjugative element protein (TIGR03749 family) [Rhizobium subbaraonis]